MQHPARERLNTHFQKPKFLSTCQRISERESEEERDKKKREKMRQTESEREIFRKKHGREMEKKDREPERKKG